MLTDVLLYHVSPGSTFYSALQNNVVEVPTLLGTSFTAEGRHLIDGAPDLQDPRIKNPLTDIESEQWCDPRHQPRADPGRRHGGRRSRAAR